MNKIITKAAISNEPNGKKDAFRERIYGLIIKSVGSNYVLGIPQAFIKYTGSLDAAAFLAQMIHWTPRAKRPDGFVFKSNAEWFIETGLKRDRISTAAKTLVAKGILEMDKKMANGSPTWHYRLNKAAFEKSFCEFLESDAEYQEKQKGLLKSTGCDAAIETQLESDNEMVDTAIAMRPVFNIEAALRSLIQNIPPTKVEEDALARLCSFVEEGTYTANEIAGCTKWILESFDLVTVTPTAIERRMPTYLAKNKAGVFSKPKFETTAERNERILKERNKEEIIKNAKKFGESRKYIGKKRKPVLM